jgi:type III secretory pathway component EscV
MVNSLNAIKFSNIVIMKSVLIKKLNIAVAMLMCIFAGFPSLAQSKEKIIFLNCASVLTQYNHNSSRSNKSNVQFEIEIKETKDNITFATNNSLTGASIFLSTDPNHYLKVKNISNYSSESTWHFKYDFADGAANFVINRYTGSIKIEFRSNMVTAESEGRCSRSASKLF